MATNNRKNNRQRNGIWVLIGVLALVLVAAVVLVMVLVGREPGNTPTEPATQAPTQRMTWPTIERKRESSINLGYGLTITEVGSYTGAYLEDGSDKFVNGVLMLRVTNTGEQDVQYAEIDMALSQGQAKFTLSTLPVGGTIILLEQTGLMWDAEEEYAYAILDNPVFFTQPLTLHEDKLQLQLLSGGLNVTNISGEDITGDVVIYYKNIQNGVYYGGITYRARLEGGLEDGELKQIVSNYLRADRSQIMFVTIE